MLMLKVVHPHYDGWLNFESGSSGSGSGKNASIPPWHFHDILLRHIEGVLHSTSLLFHQQNLSWELLNFKDYNNTRRNGEREHNPFFVA